MGSDTRNMAGCRRNGTAVALVAAAWALALIVPVATGAGTRATGPLVDQVYACGSFGMTPEDLADVGITVVSHFDWSPKPGVTRAWIDRCHAVGIKVLPYVSPEKAWDDFDKVQSRNPGGSIPYYHAVSPSHDRDWVLIGPDGRGVIRYGHWLEDAGGQLRPVWGTPNPNPGAWYMSPQVAGYVEAVLEGVNDTLDWGVDGVFIDNVATGRYAGVSEDHGPQFGRRGHLVPGRSIRDAYIALIGKMAATVRARGGIVLLNGGTEDVFADHRDGCMLESFVYTGGGRRVHTWPTIAGWRKRFAREPGHGRVVTALSYVGGSRERPDRADAFNAFATAAACDFLYAHAGKLSRPLLRLGIGAPTGPFVDAEGVAYRTCRGGTVAVNHGEADRRGALPAATAGDAVCDFHGPAVLTVNDGTFDAEIPRDSGRVFVPPAAALDAYLGECAFELRRHARRHAEAGTIGTLASRVAHLRERGRAGADMAAQREAILSLTVPAQLAMARWRLAQAASLVSGVEVRADRPEGPLIQGGSAPLIVTIRNRGAAAASLRFREPEAPRGYRIDVPEPGFRVPAGATHRATVTIHRSPTAAQGRRRFEEGRIHLGCSAGTSRFGLTVPVAAHLAEAIALEAPEPAVCLLDGQRRPLVVAVHNRTREAITARLVARLPEGWQSKAIDLDLGPRQVRHVDVDVTPPPDLTNQLVDAALVLEARDVDDGSDASLAHVPGEGTAPPRPEEILSRKVKLHAVPGVVVPPTSGAPTLDGRLDDACWAQAARIDALRSYHLTGRPAEDDTLTGPSPAAAATDVLLTYDARALYIAFRCHRERMDNLRARLQPGAEGAGMDLWRDDHVECYLDAGRGRDEAGSKSCQLMVNPLGALRNLGGAAWAHAAARDERGWTVEMAFPFTNTGQPPAPGDRWGANFVRYDYGGASAAKNQRSEWSCTFGGERSPYKFGVLLFGP